MKRLAGILCLGLSFTVFATRGWVENSDGKNWALIVGVANGLPGIDIDVRNVDKMATHEEYKFQTVILQNSQGTVKAISDELTQLSERTAEDGTLYFYFSGHGNRGVISVKDRLMKVNEIRSAIEKGRAELGPIERLVLMFDSCYSGTLLDPFKKLFALGWTDEQSESVQFAQMVSSEMLNPSRGPTTDYWKSLFVFAACRANETSLASSQGSIFTNAMKKAFNESMSTNDTMSEFVKKTQRYTSGHHPVARFAPVDLENEKMRP